MGTVALLEELAEAGRLAAQDLDSVSDFAKAVEEKMNLAEKEENDDVPEEVQKYSVRDALGYFLPEDWAEGTMDTEEMVYVLDRMLQEESEEEGLPEEDAENEYVPDEDEEEEGPKDDQEDDALWTKTEEAATEEATLTATYVEQSTDEGCTTTEEATLTCTDVQLTEDEYMPTEEATSTDERLDIPWTLQQLLRLHSSLGEP